MEYDHTNEINHDINKGSLEKNMAAVSSGISVCKLSVCFLLPFVTWIVKCDNTKICDQRNDRQTHRSIDKQ